MSWAIDEAEKTCVVRRETESALSHPESISTGQAQHDGVDQPLYYMPEKRVAPREDCMLKHKTVDCRAYCCTRLGVTGSLRRAKL